MAENHRDLYYTRRNGMDRPASTGMYYSSAWESKLHELVVSSALSFAGFLELCPLFLVSYAIYVFELL